MTTKIHVALDALYQSLSSIVILFPRFSKYILTVPRVLAVNKRVLTVGVTCTALCNMPLANQLKP